MAFSSVSLILYTNFLSAQVDNKFKKKIVVHQKVKDNLEKSYLEKRDEQELLVAV